MVHPYNFLDTLANINLLNVTMNQLQAMKHQFELNPDCNKERLRNISSFGFTMLLYLELIMKQIEDIHG